MTATSRHDALEEILTLVSRQTGLHIAPGRRAEADAGIRRALARAGIKDPRRYLVLLERAELSFDDLITELTVRETYFFREATHFDFIRREVIPDVASRRGRDHLLRAWTAGCASGEEAYSLAIALEEGGHSANLLATDISREALRKARDAVYGRWSLRDLDGARLSRWFRRVGERWQLDSRIRDRVTFEIHNLATHAYPSLPAGIWGMDVILCRNVLIYFDKAGVEHVARGLHDSLADGGWLITGPSDPSLDGLASLRAVTTEAGVFYRRPRGSLLHASTAASLAPPRNTARHEPPAPVAPVAPVAAPASSPSPSDDPVALAGEAFERGDYERVRSLLQDPTDERAAILYVRATANCRGSEEAAREARREAAKRPLCAELHFLEATLLMGCGRTDDAIVALRRVLYLDRSSAIAEFVLGSILRGAGRLDDARKSYRAARDLARARPREERLPLADGEQAGKLADLAEAELSLLEANGGAA